MTPMTRAQADYLLVLCNKVSGESYGYLGQHRELLGISSTGMQRITKGQASALIDKMKARAEDK